MAHVRSAETVADALRMSDLGIPDAENALLHAVAVKTIRRWRRDYQRRELPRGQQHLQARCPRCEDGPLPAAAYAELLGWYLGDGHLTEGRRGVFALHIYNDERYVVLNEHVRELMRQVKPECRPHTRRVPGCLITTVSWKHWPCLFPQHGPGRKHERALVLEAWQQEIVGQHPGELLRGLFHSDGCRSNNWATRTVAGVKKRYDYPRWQFVNHSAEIRGWCTEALDALEIPWRLSRWNCVSVSTRAGVARMDEVVGPKR